MHIINFTYYGSRRSDIVNTEIKVSGNEQ